MVSIAPSISNFSTSSTLAPSQAPPTQAQPSDFQFPPHYSFPPFFTLQPVLSTRTSQLTSWSTLIQSYCRHNSFFTLSLIDALDTPLFHNRTLSRRLSLRDAKSVIDWMASPEGGNRAEWIVAPSSKKKVGVEGEGEGGRFYVYWRRPEEWAGVIEEWVDRTGQKGTVLTLYEITESDATKKEEFHGMDGELLTKSLGMLVKRGKAQVFGSDGGEGVKFF
ncbi:ESCRT-II complex, vps25 subunit [Zopfia rhizophila CBS 207.26]|uniref:Vacuolar protein-sorting-associated protein 25 n=1 Tax=Zopfia rhizophila CBS 207.26 TaxID=1314779 RepID=A0A6A6EHU9_9PEZI|nr:ESCRT-II complex, vps25 subunit [Zopfia rhizophila CBS 207.26]